MSKERGRPWDLISQFHRPWKPLLQESAHGGGASYWSQPPGLQEAEFTEHLGCASTWLSLEM